MSDRIPIDQDVGNKLAGDVTNESDVISSRICGGDL